MSWGKLSQWALVPLFFLTILLYIIGPGGWNYEQLSELFPADTSSTNALPSTTAYTTVKGYSGPTIPPGGQGLKTFTKQNKLPTTTSTEVYSDNGETPTVKFQSYTEALKSRSGSDKIIILSYIDLGVKSMALNFYITSLKAHNISNFLFLSSSSILCDGFQGMGIPCYLYMNDTASTRESLYLSKDFIRKMNIRTFMILEALKLGYNVLHTDVDMYFFRNPLPRITSQCGSCDVAPLWDCGAHNAGFLFIRSTKNSINMYERMKHIAETTKKDDQKALNIAIGAEKKKGLKLKQLIGGEFQCGMRYFESEHRTFAGDNPCKNCRVVHNNWIVSTEAKIYRFKEMHMWMNDGDHGYYSDPNRKYLVYGNPVAFENETATWEHEKEALMNALAIGKILNRTVILPRFHCKNGKLQCTLLQHIKLIHFDTYFSRSYRESTFLSHPLVPKHIAKFVTSDIVIQSDITKKRKIYKSGQLLQPDNSQKGAMSHEIKDWLSNRTEPLLQFYSLYDAFNDFSDPHTTSDFWNTCSKAFQKTKPHQF